jgi:hypothetical protein
MAVDASAAGAVRGPCAGDAHDAASASSAASGAEDRWMDGMAGKVDGWEDARQRRPPDWRGFSRRGGNDAALQDTSVDRTDADAYLVSFGCFVAARVAALWNEREAKRMGGVTFGSGNRVAGGGTFGTGNRMGIGWTGGSGNPKGGGFGSGTRCGGGYTLGGGHHKAPATFGSGNRCGVGSGH